MTETKQVKNLADTFINMELRIAELEKRVAVLEPLPKDGANLDTKKMNYADITVEGEVLCRARTNSGIRI